MHKLILAGALAAAGATAQAVTVQLPPAADATLYEDLTGSLANCTGSRLFAGVTAALAARRAVLRFDVAAALPAGARIVAVELRMFVSRSLVSTPIDVTLHRLTNSWNEGPTAATGPEGAGALAAAGDVTWIDREKGRALWTTPGGDYDAVASGVSATPQSGPCAWPSTTRMVADVQQWLDAPSTDFGWLLRTDEQLAFEVRRFDSRENPIAGNRPVLAVTYLQAGQWTAVGAGCGSVVPTLAVAGTLAPGGNLDLVLQGAPGAPAANFLTFGLVQPPLAIAPGCDLFLDPALATTPGFGALDAGGQLVDSFALPAAAVLTGIGVAAQGANIDGGVPHGFALSNAVYAILQ